MKSPLKTDSVVLNLTQAEAERYGCERQYKIKPTKKEIKKIRMTALLETLKSLQ